LGVWDRAHNTYLEVLQGLGLIFGTALMAALGLLIFRCLMGAIRRQRNITSAVTGAAAALVVGTHAMVDFSLQIEGVTLTFMALLGAGVAQSESSRHAVSD
jgi:O-antigen ligase